MVKGGSRRVLIVEDHADLLNVMVDLVESWGHTVRSAADGEQALAIALAWQPHVVCLDLVLPRMNGLEVARRIVAAFSHDRPDDRPVLIAVTGRSGDIDRELASAAGFDAFFAKPDHIDLLRQVLGGDPPLPATVPAAKGRG